MEEIHQDPFLLPLVRLEKTVEVHMRQAAGDTLEPALKQSVLRGFPELLQGGESLRMVLA